jgi:hypothetical protein
MDAKAIPQDDVLFFLNVAVIGGALIGLAFVSLTFFLVDLLKRYKKTALPVFRHREKPARNEQTRRFRKMTPPDSMTDFELLDGDPLVVFIAFSVSVTWNFFLLPLTIGLTAGWGGARLSILAVELFISLIFLTFSVLVREIKIRELKPYLTREELFWPYFTGMAFLLFAGTTGVVAIAAMHDIYPGIDHLAFWNRWSITDEHAAVFMLKAVCILSLLLGTYTTNKDMFIFFKTVAAERMRQRWIEAFVQETYPDLKKRVESAIKDIPAEEQKVDLLVCRWNHGHPDAISTHDALKKAGPKFVHELWVELINRRSGAASWMLDIPSIANWAADLEDMLVSKTNRKP